MRNHLIFGLGALAMLAIAPVQAQPTHFSLAQPVRERESVTASDTLRQDLSNAKEKVYPALVNITVVERYFQDGRAQRSPAGGSGVIVSKDGYVITNFHVAGNTTHIVCTLTTGETIDADDIADDPLSDLSVLKLRVPKNSHHAPFPYAEIGDSDQLKVGDFVLAMGNPLMLSSSMTLGIASNTKRVFTDFTGTEISDMELDHGERTGIFTRWIQHDALILPGNSGGPLVNLRGQVVGINELGGDGQGFAIPSNIVSSVFHQILKNGRVIRGTLGVTVMPVQKIGRTTGALVSGITPGQPAARAGVKPGDIIVSLDDNPTNVEFFEEVPLFYQKVADLKIGQHVALHILRSGKPITLTATISELPKYEGDEDEFRTAGVTVRNLTPAVALSNYLPDTNGVQVTGVRPGYPFESAEPQIQTGDVIRSVANRPVLNIDSFRKDLASVKGTSYSVGLLRKDESLISIVKPDDNKPPQSGGDLPQAWLGVKTQVMVPELATALGTPNQTGFRITEVYPWTEASKASLQTGDIIVALNGTTLDASRPQDAEDLTHAIEDLNVGDKATLTVLRGGVSKQISVVLEPNPTSDTDAKSSKQKEFEFAVREITLTDKAENHWDKDQAGLLVTDVTPGGWAHVGGLHSDDLIVTVNGKAVSTVVDFERTMTAINRAHPKVIELFVRRDYLTQYVFIEPDWSKLTASE